MNELHLSTYWCEIPAIVPAGWQIHEFYAGGQPAARMIIRDFGLLRVSHSIEGYAGEQAPMGWPGVYARVVISHRSRYPTWDEMSDLIRGRLLFFDRSRDVFMLIPPEREYINVAQTAFHWWQRLGDWQPRSTFHA